MLKKIAELDTELFVLLNNLGTTFWDPFWLIFTEKYTHIPLVIVLGILLYKTIGLKYFLYSLLFITILMIITDQFTNFIKHTFERARPCRVPEIEDQIRYIAKRCSRFGYFSGHSSNSMALAIFIGLLLKPKFKYALPLLVFWALMMGYSRIYVGVHYPADVVTGFAFGTLLSLLFYWIYKKVVKKIT